MLVDRDKDLIRWLEEHHAISISQANVLFFHNYKSAARRLSQLQEMDLLKSYENKLTNEKIYYYDKKLSSHDLLKYDFYKKIVENKGEVIRYDKQPRYLNDLIRSDGYFEFKFNNLIYCVILEIECTNPMKRNKMILYEKLYREGTLIPMYGVDPMLVLIGMDTNIRYNSRYVPLVYLEYKLTLFQDLILF